MGIGEIATIIGMLASIAAIVGLMLELRSSRLALQTEALLSLEERFYSDRMTQLRRCAARNLLLKCELNEELEDTLDFFHTVCSLNKRRVIDHHLTVEFYCYWIARYWIAARSYIEAVRRIDDPNTYKTFESMARSIIEKSDGVNFSEDAMRVFLLKEAGITPAELRDDPHLRTAVDAWRMEPAR